MPIFHSKAQGALHTGEATERSFHDFTILSGHLSESRGRMRNCPGQSYFSASHPDSPNSHPTAYSLASYLHKAVTCMPERLLHYE